MATKGQGKGKAAGAKAGKAPSPRAGAGKAHPGAKPPARRAPKAPAAPRHAPPGPAPQARPPAPPKAPDHPAPAASKPAPEAKAPPAPTPKRPPKRAARPAAPAAPEEVEEASGGEGGEAAEPLEPEVVDERAPAALPLEPEIAAVEEAEEEAPSRLPVPAGRDLTHADALQRYLAEISRHPLLTREEEHDLATRFLQTRDPALAYRLVTANLRLVVKIAFEFRRAAFNVLDLIQEGNVGLMQAVQKYDPTRGVKLSSYSAWWIRAYILRYLMDNWRMVKLGTTQAQRKLFFNLRKEQEKLIAQGFAPDTHLLAQRLDVSEQDVREMDQRLGNDEFSLDTPLSGGSEDSRQTYLDRLSETRGGADEQLGEEELRRVFKQHLDAFGRTLADEKDRFLFAHRIAVPEGQEPLTLQEVGDRYGFTRERARQLEARLTDRLRAYLKERMPDFAQLSMREEDEA